MKKLLSSLAAVSLFANFTSTAIACNPGKKINREENYVLPEINNEQYSNLFHAQNPTQGMMNDIQGGFYRDGKWHIYFLQNADGIFDHYGYNHGGTGSVWYHATTTDWINWTYEGPAVPKNTPQYGDQASGTFYEDKENKFGFDKDGKAIIAITTSYSTKGQNIMMFYSIDGGYHFTPIKEEPIVWNPHKDTNENFRDPYFFVKDDLYTLYIAEGDEFGVWTSKSPTSDYKKVGTIQARHPMLECPNLFEMKVNGSDTEKKWVLMYGGNGSWGENTDELSTGTYYSVGHLDENNVFVEEQTARRIDFGPDFYAAKFMTEKYTNTDIDSLLTTAWVSNWNYNFSIPNDGRFGNMSLPREIKLTKSDSDFVMKSTYLDFDQLITDKDNTESQDELDDLVKVETPIEAKDLSDNLLAANNFAGKTFKLTYTIPEIKDYSGVINIKLGDDQYKINAKLDFKNDEISVTRTITQDFIYGKGEFEKERKYSAPLSSLNGASEIEIFVDTTIVEFSFPDGSVFTMLKFPDAKSKEDISLETTKELDLDFKYYQITKK